MMGRQYVPVDTIATRVQSLRWRLGLSQRQAAERAGLTFGEWQGIEDGRSVRDLHVKLRQISETFALDGVPVSLDWLLWGDIPDVAVRVELSRKPEDAGQSPFPWNATPVAPRNVALLAV